MELTQRRTEPRQPWTDGRLAVRHEHQRPATAVPAGPFPAGTFLADLSREAPAVTVALLRIGRVRAWRPGEALLREGEPARDLVVLLSGCVKVTATTEDGDVALLAVRGRGDVVDETAATDDRPSSATVTADGGRVTGCRVTREAFAAFLRRHPPVLVALHRTVGERLRVANRRRLEFGGYPVQVRLARALAELAAEFGEDTPAGRRIGVRLTQPELASLVGAGTESVQSALRHLRGQGVLATGYREITVLSPEGLARVARTAR